MVLLMRSIIVMLFVSPALIAVIGKAVQLPDASSAIRDALIIGSIGLLAMTRKRGDKPMDLAVSILPIAIYLMVAAVTAVVEPFLVGASIRQLFAPDFLILFAMLWTTRPEAASTAPFLVRCCLWVAIFGVFERFTHFWGLSGLIEDFFLAKKIGVLSSGYPFIFLEPTQILGFNEFPSDFGVLRASSTLLDPINLGHVMVAGMVGFAYIKERQPMAFTALERRFIPWILFATLVLSISKGALLQFAILVILFPAILPIPYVNLLFGVVGLIAGGQYVVTHAGFTLHLSGLTNALDSASVTGLGLGRAGNYAAILGSDSVDSVSSGTIGDSFFGAVFGQIGLLGLSLWLLPFLALSIRPILQRNLMPVALIWTQLIVAILSENSFNFGSIFVTIILWISFTQLGEASSVAQRRLVDTNARYPAAASSRRLN